jgi:TonB family protein
MTAVLLCSCSSQVAKVPALAGANFRSASNVALETKAHVTMLTIAAPKSTVTPQDALYSVPWPRGPQGELLTGTTIVLVRVDVSGKVSYIKVDTSSGIPALDTIAVEGVRREHFNPAKRNGIPIEAYARVPIAMFP